MNLRIEGRYFDGHNSEASSAQLVFDGVGLSLQTEAFSERIDSNELQASDRLGTTPRMLSWGQAGRFVTANSDQVDELLATLGLKNNLGWVVKLESRLAIALAAIAIAVVFAVGFAVYGVPAIANQIAQATPASVSNLLAQSTLRTLERILEPSELSAERQGQLRTYFRDHAELERLEFRKASAFGANALTLSATTVVFTDELVALAENDAELLAVYFHEVGHARMQHVEKTIVQNSAWAVLLSVLVGDVTGAGGLILTLPVVVGQMAYSRELEREADQYAIDALAVSQHSPTLLADMLVKLENSRLAKASEAMKTDEEHTEVLDEADVEETTDETTDESWAERMFEYLATHPATEERLKHIRSFALEATPSR